MKKKTNIIIGTLIILVVVILMILLLVLKNDEVHKKTTYSNINIDGYQFDLNDKYQYKYLENKQYGILENKEFLSSYIYISNKSYADLIKSTSTYTNMGSTELDSSIEETKFGEYQGFINVKKVHYDDVNKDYILAIILIKVEEEKTLVFQYETEIDGEENKILEEIKNNLSEIKKI